MTDVNYLRHPRLVRRRFGATLDKQTISLIHVVVDGFVIMMAAVAAQSLYHIAYYGTPDISPRPFELGALTSLFYVLIQSGKAHYGTERMLTQGTRYNQMLASWTMAIACVLVVGFLTKQAALHSRGSVLLFYVMGFITIAGSDGLVVSFVRRGVRAGWLSTRGVLLVGTMARTEEFLAKHRLDSAGVLLQDIHIIGPGASGDASLAQLEIDLQRSVDKARGLEIDEILLVLPWSDPQLIDRCAQAFSSIPVRIQLWEGSLLDRFADVHAERIGGMTSIAIARPPMTLVERLTKRLLDLTIASLALVLLLPVLLLLALWIKLDSRGPALFRQRRHGFNQQTFRIFKFRTMTTLDDGPVVTQAKVDDPRITRAGRFLRRTSLDELPQLLNVLRGEMSIVGPRPHAIAHNEEYERRIARYARRHNVKPGITGWAQINGFRGETDTEDKMRARIEHDLFYIDNWSITFDLYIVLRTLLSPTTFRNAR
ncbi:MAG: undecaprenyl-phosphate glucose phosphotransferase [Hyphomicrobiaceae bacterium]